MRFFGILLILIFSSSLGLTDEVVFRLDLANEPSVLDPSKLSGTGTSHLMYNLFRGLFEYDDKEGIRPLIAKSCKRSNTKLKCQLKNGFGWSDGSPVTAEDFVRSFRRTVSPETKSREAGLLLTLKNASEIVSGKLPPDKLGVKALGPSQIEFEFSEPDYDFEAKLASPVLSPIKVVPDREKSETLIFNGPYKIANWKTGKRVRLEPNFFYSVGNPKRPAVEMLFIDEAATALNLYKKGELSLLVMLPTSEKEAFAKSPDYILSPLIRFDYIGFGPSLREHKNLREALALAPNYQDFVKLFGSVTPPGCTGLPQRFFDHPPCLKRDLERAKMAFELAKKQGLPPLTYHFTKIATDDLRRGAEFYQSQWKTLLDLRVDLETREFAMFRQMLKTAAPPIFRTGVSLDRPTCLAALEGFESSSPDNFVKYQNPKFDRLIQNLRKASAPRERQRLCRKGVEMLTQDYAIIPQGGFEFGRLLSPKFTGVRINAQGQIDLSQLSVK